MRGSLMEIKSSWANVYHELEGTPKVNIRAVSYLFFSVLTFHKGKEEMTYENSVLLTWGQALRPPLGP
jgi:hypothetical protein